MNDDAKPNPAAAVKFREAMKRILSVPKEVIVRREADEKKQREDNRSSQTAG